MKILAATDIHGDTDLVKRLAKKAIENKVEVIVLCGDLTLGDKQVNGIIKPLKDTGIPVLLIPGNHESEATIDFFANFYGQGVYNLHGYALNIKGVGFFGCAGTNMGVFAQNDTEIEKMLKESHEKIKGLEKKVMVVHEPPFGTELDNLGFFVGSQGVRHSILELKPDFCLCGHIHETFGKKDKIKNTKVINVGREGTILEI